MLLFFETLFCLKFTLKKALYLQTLSQNKYYIYKLFIDNQISIKYEEIFTLNYDHFRIVT